MVKAYTESLTLRNSKADRTVTRSPSLGHSRISRPVLTYPRTPEVKLLNRGEPMVNSILVVSWY